MGFILIGALLILVFITLLGRGILPDSIVSGLIVIPLILGGVAFVLLGVFTPTGGYDLEVETKKTQVFDLERCVDKRGNVVYTFFTEEKDGSYRLDSVAVEGTVQVTVKESDVNSSIMIVYVEKARQTFWSWAVDCDREKIVFYVPLGTITG